MALSNKERIGRVMDALKQGLAPFVIREYKMVYKKAGYWNEMDLVLGTNAYSGLPVETKDDEEALASELDVQACFNLMWRRWNEVFQAKLGHNGRSYVSELMDARNNWAHQSAFSNDEAYRVADTADRLLKMVTAADQASQVEEIARELLRLRYEREAKKAKTETVPQEGEVTPTTKAGLKPWREVIQPHRDVASGRYIQAEFAADLAQVLAGTAEPEYQDAREFFRRTYLTEGLQAMLVSGVKRLTAQGGEPVVQLQTAFGGGKTHSMLALYHLVGGQIRLEDIPGGERVADEIGNVDLPDANTAVLVGTALDPTKARQYPDASVNTLWGELAYQLGGKQAYEVVEKADVAGVNPGSDTLKELFFDYGPCLIIIDELVAYARNLYGVDRLPAGSFETIMSFMQSLTEAVRGSDESLLLVSVPASDIEVGGDAGKQALETLAHIVGRIESVWKPVSATESFEIVRRRLFASEIDFAARDATINAFGDMYRNDPGEFPSGVAEKDYLDRMRASYPIHPELFDRLYQDWSTLDRFQRTRGVLRLMAAAIHQLWSRGDQSVLIMPGTLPLNTSPVRNELLRYLPDTWTAVFDIDIDGVDSRPFKIDGEVPHLGKFGACRRVTRTVFLGSAPSAPEMRVRGVEEVRITLGCVQPGEQAAVFGDALRRLGGQLTYLYTDGTRYWYDTRPTVNKLARDRAMSYKMPEIYAEIVGRLRQVPRKGDFAAYHIAPPDTSDVTDTDQARIVVLHPENSHKKTTATTEAMEEAERFLGNRGTAQRLYKNMLLFLAADEHERESLISAVRDYLSWHSIEDEKEELNLDAQQRRQVGTSLGKADETVDLRLLGAYSWLIVPTQPNPLGDIEFQVNRISGSDNFYERAAHKLRNDGLLIDVWSPDILRMELMNYVWGEDKAWEVKLKQLWEYLAQYVYWPRLSSSDVLMQAVRDGVRRLDAPFAYATGVDEEGYHTGVVYRASGQVYFDDRGLLVHPDHLSEREPPPPTPPPGGDGGGKDKPEPVPRLIQRYYGRASLDTKALYKEFDVIVEEVIQRLASLVDTDVEVTMEIRARRSEGFDEQTVRTVGENSRTLKFDQHEFS